MLTNPILWPRRRGSKVARDRGKGKDKEVVWMCPEEGAGWEMKGGHFKI